MWATSVVRHFDPIQQKEDPTLNKKVWTSDLSVGVAALDEQHKQLLSIINDLIDHEDETIHSETVSSAFGRLISYTRQHFALEEEVMRTHAFPGFNEHRARHIAFTENLIDMMLGFDKMTMQDLIEFLVDWFDNHIRHDDQDYAEFFARSSQS